MKLNKLSIVFVFLLSLSLFSCSEDDKVLTPNYVAFEVKTLQFGLEEDQSTTKAINVYTTNIVGTDRTFIVEVDAANTTASAANYTLPGTVTVPANSNKGELTLGYNNVDLAAGAKKLTLKLVAEAGLSVGSPIAINLVQVCNFNTVKLTLTLDAYGSETTWTLYDGDLNVLYTGGPYVDGGTAAPETWCLPNGDYTFLIEDSYGDGMAPGTFVLTRVLADGTSVELGSGGAFASFDTKTFTLN